MRTAFSINLVWVSALAAVCLCATPLRNGAQDTPVPAGTAVPQWPKAFPAQLPTDGPSVHSRELQLIHSRDPEGGFGIRVAGKPMAIGLRLPYIAYSNHGQLIWLDLAQAANKRFVLRAGRNSFRVTLTCADADGAQWEIRQQFSAAAFAGAIEVRTEVKVDQNRAIIFLPMLMIFPGVGAFGETKGQGLFAGLEYLENEPSSSEADVVGAASKRQVPDNLKITFPLMAIQAEGRYVALTWEMQPQFSAVFDSPDRLCSSGGHVMGLLFPGSDGKNREEGSLLPRASQLLPANQPLVLRATLLGGLGNSVVPAIQQYVSLRPLPSLPEVKSDLQEYVSLAAGGWLDSAIGEGNLFRHAVGANFNPAPAADAAVWMDWLAARTRQPALASRLDQAARGALSQVPPQDWNQAAVGHTRYPLAALVYGHVAENATRASENGRRLLQSFDPDGSVRYHARESGLDLGKTHFTNEASGLTSGSVESLLEAAGFSGDRDLLEAALNRLRGMDKFRNGVPRGAQTWECPLHTPDILASAHLVRAYTLGYELSGAGEFLDQARYWAWTGVLFVYLVNPTAGPIGPYATIAVFGATHWQAPVWMGLPVQWCGLVYAEALYRLARHDATGPWKQLADGITLSGLQQTWPLADPKNQGLLPDSFVLRAQKRNGPAINPATLQACAAQYFCHTPVYDFFSFRKNGLLVHAPGEIKNALEVAGRVSFRVESWLNRPYFVLINGFTRKPTIKINGKPSDAAGRHQFLQEKGSLIVELEGTASLEIVE